jgi:hypothetical protein
MCASLGCRSRTGVSIHAESVIGIFGLWKLYTRLLMDLSSATLSPSLVNSLKIGSALSLCLMTSVHWPHASEYTVCMLSARCVLRLTTCSSSSFSQSRFRVLSFLLARAFGGVSFGRESSLMATLRQFLF